MEICCQGLVLMASSLPKRINEWRGIKNKIMSCEDPPMHAGALTEDELKFLC